MSGMSTKSRLMLGSSVNSGSVDDLAVFLDETAYVRVQQKVENCLGRTAECHSLVRHDDRPIDEDRMRHHLVNQVVIAPGRPVQAEIAIRRSLLSEQFPWRHRHGREQRDEPGPRRRVLHIFDDDRLFAALSDHRQRVAGRAAVGIVVNRDRHRFTFNASAMG